MTGYAHDTCRTKVHCHHVGPLHCLCGLTKEDLRQKYLDPALIFVKGADDNRVIHFIQPDYKQDLSEYRSNFKWPDTKHPVTLYETPIPMIRYESKAEYDKQYGRTKPKKEEKLGWSKGIAERIFEK